MDLKKLKDNMENRHRPTKKQLEITLSKLEGFARQNPLLEQWATPGDIAATLLLIARERGDIEGKSVYDLGCGPGIFSIGAALIGARRVVGIDMDGPAVEAAKRNLEKAAGRVRNVEFKIGDVLGFEGPRFDTVIQNPPFGTRLGGRHADSAFLAKAIQLGRVIYSLHKSDTRSFINRFLDSFDGLKWELLGVFSFPLPAAHEFHKKRRLEVRVDLVRIEKKGEEYGNKGD